MGRTQGKCNEASSFKIWCLHKPPCCIVLIEDTTTKSQHHSKLQGYLKKWIDAKCVLGCAFFSDLLQPCATFSRSMQTDGLIY